MKKPNFCKNPISLALTGLLFTGFNVQAEDPNGWGPWAPAGGGSAGGGTGSGFNTGGLGGTGGSGGTGGGGSGNDNDGVNSGNLAQTTTTNNIQNNDIQNNDIGDGITTLTDPPANEWGFLGFASDGEGNPVVAVKGSLTLIAGTADAEGGEFEGGEINLQLDGGAGGFNWTTETADSVFVGSDTDGGTNPYLGFEGNVEGEFQFCPSGSACINLNGGEGVENGQTGLVFTEEFGSFDLPGNGLNEGTFIAGQFTPIADIAGLTAINAIYTGTSSNFSLNVNIGINFNTGNWSGEFTEGEGSFNFNAAGTFVGASSTTTNVSVEGATAVDGTVNIGLFGSDVQAIGGNFDVSATVDGEGSQVVDVFIATQPED